MISLDPNRSEAANQGEYNYLRPRVPGYSGASFSANVNSKVIDMEIRIGLDRQEPKKPNSSEIDYSEILKSKRAQIFFIQIPDKAVFNGEYKRQIVTDFSNLKKTYKDLEVGMSIQSDTNQFSPEMTRINDYIVLDMIGVISIDSFESVITNPDRLRMLLRICREHDVEILDHKGKNIRADKETELAIQEILELSL